MFNELVDKLGCFYNDLCLNSDLEQDKLRELKEIVDLSEEIQKSLEEKVDNSDF